MRKLFHFSIAVVAVMALLAFSANPIFAEAKVSGNVAVTFGQYTVGGQSEDTSSLRGDGHSDINITGGTESVVAKARLRIREDTRSSSTTAVDLDGDGVNETDFLNSYSGLAAARMQLTWKTSDQLSIDFYGQSFGVANTDYSGSYEVGLLGHGLPVGGLTAGNFGGGYNSQGINVNFDLGTMAVGVAILDDCHGPGCDGADSEKMTLVPHFYGNFGSISVGAHYVMASGTDSSGATSPAGSEIDIGVKFNTDTLGVGFEYSSSSNTAEDAISGMALGLQVAGVQFHYVTTGTDDVNGNGLGGMDEIAVAYKMSLGGADAYPMFATRTYVASDAAATAGSSDTTDQYIGFGMKTGF